MSRGRLSPVKFAAVSTLLAVLGLSTIWFTVLSLWTLWTTDALKSIGMVIPLVSLILILRVWRGLDWRSGGTWWGLALLLVTAVAVRIQQQTILIMVVSPSWSTVLPPPSLVLMAYGSGVVLLLGGVRLYRAALFPILLLWFANPVPHVFTSLVDLPLQHASAHVARAFAMKLGHTLTPDHLRLMFTPDFGMFIAPGCDGIRGSVTMGFIALIAGYVYRFRWYANALVVLGAVLLGYVFNLARLCLLVLYYAVALHYPSLQNKAENADYLIGAVLFLSATLLLFSVIHRLRDDRSVKVLVVDSEQGRFPDRASRVGGAKLAAMGAIVLLGCAGLTRGRAAVTPYAMAVPDVAVERFPENVGNYTLVRTWNETLVTGPIVYVWAEYIATKGGSPISIGISPVLGWHDPLICHFARGEQPLWHGQLTVVTAGTAPVNFSSSFYSDGVTRYLEAATICSGGACGEFATERTHFGFVYTRPRVKSLISDDPERPIPVMLRAETLDMAMPADAVRQQLTQDLRNFLDSVRLDQLTRSSRR
ncbi:MAG: exosortase J [Acidobacteriota bacterium]|nr:exosortase J [Acidobacteriota bacterium]